MWRNVPAPLAIGPSTGGGGDAFILSTTKSGPTQNEGKKIKLNRSCFSLVSLRCYNKIRTYKQGS